MWLCPLMSNAVLRREIFQNEAFENELLYAQAAGPFQGASKPA